MDQRLFKQVLAEFTFNNYAQVVELITKIFIEAKEPIEETDKMILLKCRAKSCFELKRFTEMARDLKSLIDMGFVLQKEDELCSMYYQVLIQSKLEDVIESLQQAKIMFDLNCNREITILNRIDIESLFKKNDQNRSRSQSADRKARRIY